MMTHKISFRKTLLLLATASLLFTSFAAQAQIGPPPSELDGGLEVTKQMNAIQQNLNAQSQASQAAHASLLQQLKTRSAFMTQNNLQASEQTQQSSQNGANGGANPTGNTRLPTCDDCYASNSLNDSSSFQFNAAGQRIYRNKPGTNTPACVCPAPQSQQNTQQNTNSLHINY